MTAVQDAREPETTEPAVPLTLTWDAATTPLEAIERTLYALADIVSGTVSATDGAWQLTAHPKQTASDPESLAHRLRQEVTDQTLRLRIAERTDPVRNVVFALAFSRSGLTTEP